MGQAFRRASGRVPTAGLDRRPPAGPTAATDKAEVAKRVPPTTTTTTTTTASTTTQYSDQGGIGVGEKDDGSPRVNVDNVLEERDPQYDAMLSQMVGRIRTKPGGKLEMGEASVVEHYKRPMPKLRNTKPDSSRYEGRPAPPGTINVAQLHHMMLLHQGKADDHQGPMDVHQIAEKFRLEVSQVQRYLEFISIPPQNGNKKKEG